MIYSSGRMRQLARKNLVGALRLIGLYYDAEAEKARRDIREPGRLVKEAHEDRLAGIFRRAFAKQKRKVAEKLRWHYPDRKAAMQVPPDLLDAADFDDEDMADLIRELTRAVRGGISLFELSHSFDMDYSFANQAALEWARDYAYELVKRISKVTREAIREGVMAFIDTPGFTMGDVIGLIPLDPMRAQSIAVTEITRAYAEGGRMSGEELQRLFPDMPVVEVWFTNNDDKVCDICSVLDGQEVGLDESFQAPVEGIMRPPAHVNCRCWTQVSTKIT